MIINFYLKIEPAVIAEMLTGIILGPSVFGHIPGYMDNIFPSSSMTIFSIFANIGLVLFMFMVGLEVDVKLMTRNLVRTFSVSASGQILSWIMVNIQIF